MEANTQKKGRVSALNKIHTMSINNDRVTVNERGEGKKRRRRKEKKDKKRKGKS